MKLKTPKSDRKGLGCLMAFALPFVAVGVGMTWWCVRITSEHQAMKAWVEVPATIQSADLKTSHGDDSTTYQAVAVYEYEFGGQRFTGTRVSLHSGSDNIGRFQRGMYNTLKKHLDQAKPYQCYVNPEQPDQAVLHRQLRWEMLTFYTLFSTLFGSVGLILFVGALFAGRTSPAASDGQSSTAVGDSHESPSSEAAASGIVAGGLSALAVVTLYWNIAALPLALKLPEIFSTAQTYWVGLALIFPAVGLVLIGTLVSLIVRASGMSEALP